MVNRESLLIQRGIEGAVGIQEKNVLPIRGNAGPALPDRTLTPVGSKVQHTGLR